MANSNQNPSIWGGMKKGTKRFIVGVPLVIAAVVALYFLSPEVKQFVSKTVTGIEQETTVVDNQMATGKLAFPSSKPTSKPMPRVKFMGYLWNGVSGWSAAVGNNSPQTATLATAEGSLMEKAGINLVLESNESFDAIQNSQLAALKEFHSGNNFPVNGAIGVWIMGDGAPYYISVIQKRIDDIYGAGKYHAKVVAAAGLSYGEDRLIGPRAWKSDPQKLRGALVSTVVGDGDWVIVVNYAAQLGIPVNPDEKTYDPNAVNFVHAEGGSIARAGQDFIASVKKGYKVELAEIINGKRTGKTVQKAIDATSVWFPVDKQVFDAVGDGYVSLISTKEYNNQMPNTLIIIDEWAQKNSDLFEKMLVAMYTATNQIKQYDEWLRYATECNSKLFNMQNGDYWYRAFKGYSKAEGQEIGGTRVFNYADVQQYYGLNGTASRYEPVYTQIAQYLEDLSPLGYKNEIKRTIPYEEAVNLDYVQNISSQMFNQSGEAYETDYSSNRGEIVTTGNFNITFRVGSDEMDAKGREVVKQIYNQLSFSSDLKVNIIGYTSSDGDDQMNMTLSEKRAKAVRQELIRLGTKSERFGEVYGRGEENLIRDSNGNENVVLSRRVEISTTK
jgi:outer membrane protein OmpA-like peptidoglycan-associated protein